MLNKLLLRLDGLREGEKFSLEGYETAITEMKALIADGLELDASMLELLKGIMDAERDHIQALNVIEKYLRDVKKTVD